MSHLIIIPLAQVCHRACSGNFCVASIILSWWDFEIHVICKYASAIQHSFLSSTIAGVSVSYGHILVHHINIQRLFLVRTTTLWHGETLVYLMVSFSCETHSTRLEAFCLNIYKIARMPWKQSLGQGFSTR